MLYVSCFILYIQVNTNVSLWTWSVIWTMAPNEQQVVRAKKSAHAPLQQQYCHEADKPSKYWESFRVQSFRVLELPVINLTQFGVNHDLLKAIQSLAKLDSARFDNSLSTAQLHHSSFDFSFGRSVSHFKSVGEKHVALNAVAWMLLKKKKN